MMRLAGLARRPSPARAARPARGRARIRQVGPSDRPATARSRIGVLFAATSGKARAFSRVLWGGRRRVDRPRRRRCPRRDERGAAAVEFAVVVPALLLIAGMLIGAGRLANAQVAVQQWADSSARTASLARDSATAQSQARAVIASDAAASGVRCRPGWTLELDASAFGRPVGTPGEVRSSVVCPIPLADLLVPGFPGSVSVRAESTSTLDRYRGRR